MKDSHPKPQNPTSRAFLEQAYNLKTLEDAMSFYDQWADDYDEQMETGLGYVAPKRLAEKLAGHIEDKTAYVLDVGCGTGLTSRYLSEFGFKRIDGIDINAAMLDVARQRRIYSDLLEADITQDLEIGSGRYGAIISTGTFTLGHVGADALDELIRVLKPGGLLACTIHKDVFGPLGFREAFERFESHGTLQQIERSAEPYFRDGAPDGLYCLYSKL